MSRGRLLGKPDMLKISLILWCVILKSYCCVSWPIFALILRNLIKLTRVNLRFLKGIMRAQIINYKRSSTNWYWIIVSITWQFLVFDCTLNHLYISTLRLSNLLITISSVEQSCRTSEFFGESRRRLRYFYLVADHFSRTTLLVFGCLDQNILKVFWNFQSYHSWLQ